MQPTKKKFRAAALKSGYSSATKRSREGTSTRSSPHSPRSASLHLSFSSSKITPRGKRHRKSTSSSLSTDDDDLRALQNPLPLPSILLDLPEELLFDIFTFFVSRSRLDMENFRNIQLVDKRFNELVNSPSLWKFIPLQLSDGSLNINTLLLIKEKNKGTEGTCYHVKKRADKTDLALKRARVYPDNEGVPYYMMRELAALKKINHPNISSPLMVNLKDFKLFLLLPYVEKTLHDFLNPSGDMANPMAEVVMKKEQVNNIMVQICSAVAHIHDKGILHRNLKPKHLLVIPGNGFDPLDGAQVRLADFALVRVLRHPPKKLTNEVITLWYRPPEILMGQREYTAAVDVWSIGCIFAELLQGKALFAGLCEIDQLFQIFQILGTPKPTVWPEFTDLPYYQETIFPNWHTRRLASVVSHATKTDFDFLAKCLQYDPQKRISALECLQHDYLRSQRSQHISPQSHQSEALMVGSRSSSCDESTVSSKDDTTELNVDKYNASSELVNLHKTTLRQYSFLRSLEPTRDTLPSYSVLAKDVEWNFELREKMATWVIEIATAYDPSNTCQRTAFFAMSLLDAYYARCLNPQSSTVVTCSMDIVGACCMHIASKCEDVSYIGIRDLASSLHNNYEPAEFLLVEEEILNIFQFDLYIPTVVDFLGLYCTSIPEVCNASREIATFCEYLAMSTLLTIEFNAFEPSRVATAIVSYALSYNPDGTKQKDEKTVWPASLESLSQYRPYDLVACTQRLQEMQRQAILSATPSVVFRQYMTANQFSVARWFPH